MAAIRGGCLPLAVETGRLQTHKISLSCCLCIHCNSNNVEDEKTVYFNNDRMEPYLISDLKCSPEINSLIILKSTFSIVRTDRGAI